MKREAIKMMRWAVGWLLAVTVLLSGSSGLVLCIGDDGHFAVEPAHQGHCGHTGKADDHGHDAAASSGPGSAVNDDGRCVDVSLGLDNVSLVVKDVRHNRFLKDSASRDLSVGFLALTEFSRYGTQRPACGATSRLATFLLAQRTVVLRI